MIRNKMIAILVLLVSLAVAMGYESTNDVEDRLPGGDWTIRFHLYQAEGFDSIPVRVFKVRSEGEKGLTEVGLRNRSSKSVIAVRIGWYVSTEGGPGTILAKGESPLLALPATFQANETLQFNVPPVSLVKILKPLLKRNTLQGDLGVQVLVTEIVYEDGSTWKFPQPDNVAQIKVQYAHAPAPQGPCGYTCAWIPATESYACVADSQNVKCAGGPGTPCVTEACDSGGN